MTVTLYAIPNCNTVKKARDYLTDKNIDYAFHDFKKLGVSEVKLKQWCQAFGWHIVINRKGQTWRKLDEATKQNIQSDAQAIELAIQKTSIIKRPLLEINGEPKEIGFSLESYNLLFDQAF